jgi:hypothetical protein
MRKACKISVLALLLALVSLRPSHSQTTCYVVCPDESVSSIGCLEGEIAVCSCTGSPVQANPHCVEEYEPDPCEMRPWRPGCGGICPLLVQTGHGPWSLTDPDNGVLFDMDADGRRDRTSWTTPGSSLAFVALDRNHNGRIDDAAELFGEHTPLRDGSKPPNGFVALQEYDSNGDHTIDDNDAIWPFLVLWTDRNHDGVSQPTELAPILSSNITSLSTAYRWAGRHDQYGNLFRYAATCEADNSAPYYDVYLRIKR